MISFPTLSYLSLSLSYIPLSISYYITYITLHYIMTWGVLGVGFFHHFGSVGDRGGQGKAEDRN